jgi:hypothetical protein
MQLVNKALATEKGSARRRAAASNSWALLRDVKIREVKEYNDTKYASEVFGDLLANA